MFFFCKFVKGCFDFFSKVTPKMNTINDFCVWKKTGNGLRCNLEFILNLGLQIMWYYGIRLFKRFLLKQNG